MTCQIKLRMKNQCGESVGFSFRAALRFRRWFCLCQASVIDFCEIYNSNFLSFVFTVMKCNDSVSFSFFFSFFFTKKQIASFHSKQIVVVLKCSVSVLILLRDRDRV